MKKIKAEFTFENISHRKTIDLQLIMLVILLAGIGAVSLFSASWYFGVKVDKGPFYFFFRHLQFLCIGLILAIGIAYVNIEVFEKIAVILLFLSLVLNVLVFIPGLGRTVSGGTRWFAFGGIKFQPSEFIKVSLPLYLAKMFDKKRGIINDIPRTIVPALVVILLSSWIVIIQNDFTSSLFIFLLALLLLFMSGVRKSFLALISGFCLVMASAIVYLQPYRLSRIESWLDPSSDPLRGGYQVLASLRALFQGGLLGKGIGAGQVKLGHLPQAHSDFVFSVVGEETGVLGVSIVIGLFLLLFFKGISIASRQNSNFKMFIGAGFSSSIFFQAMVNMGVVSGLLPPTGIPLPFFSQGGSSIIVTMIMIGFLFNLSMCKTGEVNG